MRPRGRPPAFLVALDDCLFDAQCCADSQGLNTRTLLQFMDRADDDGRIDSDEWAYIVRHVRLEDHLNRDQGSLLRRGREHCNRVLGLIEHYRGQLQRTGRAAMVGGPQV